MQPKVLFIILLLFFSTKAFGQNFSGKYQGTAQIVPFGKLPITAEIRETKGKIKGFFQTPLGRAEIVEGSFKEGVLSLIIDSGGDDIAFTGNFSEGKLSGNVVGEILKGTFELTRTGDLLPEEDLSFKLSQSKEKWREDLRFLSQELTEKHKNAFHTVSRQKFETAVADLDKNIPKLSDHQIIFGFAKLFAMIGDGHTFFPWNQAFNPLPIQFFWFGKELRVIKVSKNFPRLNGAKVVKIGGLKVEEIFKKSLPFISQGETPQFVLEANAEFLKYPAFLYAIGAAKSPNSAVYEFLDSQGKLFAVELKTISPNEKIEWIYPYKNTPFWLQMEEKPLFFHYLKDSQTVYVKFQWYPRRKEFKNFSAELFSFLDKNPVEKIIFDLRLNGGGDFTRGRDFFIKPLKERKNLTEKGSLFVIVGRHTFSAGMSNSADFRNEFGAILVGEITGQRPNGYSENRYSRLPNSRLEFMFSVDFYKFAEKDTIGLIPDKQIEPNWPDFQNGKDSSLEWILNYRQEKTK